MEKNISTEKILHAKLIAIDNGLAEFAFYGDFINEDSDSANVFFWPEERLPKGIDLDDDVVITMDYKNKQEKVVSLKRKIEKEGKQKEMRKLLEELVN